MYVSSVGCNKSSLRREKSKPHAHQNCMYMHDGWWISQLTSRYGNCSRYKPNESYEKE
jgi:hypothetical protein